MNDKLKNIKVLFLDADGVLFSGKESRGVMDGKGMIIKTRSHLDGQGISFMREMGIKIVFVSGEGEPLDSVINKMNNLPSCISGRWSKIDLFLNKKNKGDKAAALSEFLESNGVSFEEVAYMGDDINDFEVISKINEGGGLTISPSNVTRKIAPLVQITTKADGGNGAIRELAHMIIDAKGLDETEFPFA